MNILVSGGTGLIGRAILRKITSYSYVISATYRKQIIENINVQWINFDALNSIQNEINKLIKNQDIIIHNAASLKIGINESEIEELQKVNIDFTEKLLNATNVHNIKKIIFTSTLSGIKKPLPNLITEESELNPTFFYSKSKFECEQLIQRYAAKNNFNYCILRVSSPVSSFEFLPDTVLKKWISLSIKNQPLKVFGSGNRTQDFVAVDDIANAILCCINKIEVNGIFNIASGNSISMLELAQLITTKFNTNFEKIGIDENENDKWNISIDKAKNELNYKPEFTSRQNIINLLKNINL
jgi:UDP-glucose 4-epimerase